MKHISILMLLTGAASSLPLHAADSIEVPWNQVCRAAGGRDLRLTSSNGDTVEGFCFSIDANQITVKTKDDRMVKVARKALSRLDMHRAKGHQLSSLGKGVRQSLRSGFGDLFSPWAPAGMVMIPGTLAWGAVAAPFCILGDLEAKVAGTQEIKPL